MINIDEGSIKRIQEMAKNILSTQLEDPRNSSPLLLLLLPTLPLPHRLPPHLSSLLTAPNPLIYIYQLILKLILILVDCWLYPK